MDTQPAVRQGRRRRVAAGRILLFSFTLLIGWAVCSGTVQAQQSTVDTLRILDAFGLPGDTAVIVQIYVRNDSFPVAGVTFRLIFDTTFLTPVFLPPTQTVPFPVRFETVNRGTALPEGGVALDTSATGVVNGLLFAGFSGIPKIERGAGTIMHVFFNIKPGVSLGATSPLRLINDTAQGGLLNALSDTLGNLILPVLANGTLHIQQPPRINRAPVIQPIAAQQVTQGQRLTFTVTAIDADGDPLTLQATALPANATFATVTGDSIASGTFTFVPSFSQEGDVFPIFRATDSVGAITTLSVKITVKKLLRDVLSTISDTSAGKQPVGALAGRGGVLFPIDLANTKDVLGVQFDFNFNPTILGVDSVVPTGRTQGFDRLLFDTIAPGVVRVVAYGLNLQRLQPGVTPTILNVALSVNPAAVTGKYPVTFTNAFISFDPNLPSESLAVENGIFSVDLLGDVNLDARVDVGDAVNCVAFILGSLDTTFRRFDAADVNRDSTLNVLDLAGIENIIFGRPPVAASPYIGPFARVTVDANVLRASTEGVKINAELPAEVAGAQLVLRCNPTQVVFQAPERTERSGDMLVQYRNFPNGEMRILLYNLNPHKTIAPGSGEILRLPLLALQPTNDSVLPVRLTSVVLSTPGAREIPVEGFSAGAVPREFQLLQNYPNPFNPQTTIKYRIAGERNANVVVRLQVFNILGEEVVTLVDGPKGAGEHTIIWDGRDKSGQKVSSGVYLYRLVAGSFRETKKMVLVK